MKIAFVRARYSAHGGAERFAARAASALAASGDEVDVTVIARRWGGAASDSGARVRVVVVDPFHVGRTWRDASFAAAVRARVAAASFDLVQSHERIVGLQIYRAGDGVHAAWLERRGRASSSLRRLAASLSPHHRYLVRTERAMFEHPALAVVICNSRMVRDEIAARFAIDPAKLVVIRNGVDAARFRPDPALRATMRSEQGIADDLPVFVLVGSGYERKGVAQAIDAVARVPRARLFVVGADRQAARFARRAAPLGERVRFVGAVDDVRPWLALADAFVLPTLYDPFPNAALEAFASGLPVVTTTASGAAELIEEGVDGWVVDPYDGTALVAALRDAAGRDPARRAAMSEAARRTVASLSLVAMTDELVALYERLLADPRC